MTGSERPRRLALPRSRRLTMDVLHYNRRVATCAHDRRFDLSRVAELRSRLPIRISWSLLFIKAFAIVASRRNVLRQAYVSWPWPHVIELPHSVAMMATHREYLDQRWVFWSRFSRPEQRSLIDMQRALDKYLTEPVKKAFLRQFQLSYLPTFARRCIWWWLLNVAGWKRAKLIGTFFLTTLSGKGVEIQDPPSFHTSNLTYGPLDEHGCCRVTFSYDHRLMDGAYVADCLIEWEAALNGEIAQELEQLIAAALVDAGRAIEPGEPVP
jgi:hypothetical protein